MLLELKIRVIKPFLGDCYHRDRVRRFAREGPDLSINVAQWTWAIQEAALGLKMDHVDLDCIRVPIQIRSPRLDLYERKWTDQNGKPGKSMRIEMFEAIRGGTVLTVPVVVTSVSEEAMRRSDNPRTPPNSSEVKELFKFIGSSLGLSPWGSKFGYGRFEVESLEEN